MRSFRTTSLIKYLRNFVNYKITFAVYTRNPAGIEEYSTRDFARGRGVIIAKKRWCINAGINLGIELSGVAVSADFRVSYIERRETLENPTPGFLDVLLVYPLDRRYFPRVYCKVQYKISGERKRERGKERFWTRIL